MKALLIDDQAFILATFQDELLAFDSRVTLVSVESMCGARRALGAGKPFDFVLLDLQLGGATGFDALAELCRTRPALPIVAVSACLSSADVVRAIHLGAVALVPKVSASPSLLLALQTVALGRVYVTPTILAPGPATVGRGEPPSPAGSRPLTRRQGEVLALMRQGESNKGIARALNVSVETVKDHVTAVLRTLKVSSRTQAVIAAGAMSHRAESLWRADFQAEARSA